MFESVKFRYWLCGKIGVNSPTLEKVKTAMLEASASSKTTNTVIFVAFEGASVSAPAKKEASSIPATIECVTKTDSPVLTGVRENLI